VQNLLELLRLYTHNFIRVINCIAQVSTALSVNESQSIRRDLVISALGLLDGIKPQMEAAGLKDTVSQTERLQARWNEYQDYSVFSVQCAELLHRLEDELKSRVLLIISEDVQALYEKPRFGWEECILRFPQTVDNIDEMNQCFALSRYAASVFHSLLIAETGLIELGPHIGVTDGKTGWDATCNKLAGICEAGYKKYMGQIPFNSIEQINQCMQSMKMAWRNRVYHEAGRLVVLNPDFTERQAHEIIMATRSFMRWLAKEIPR
jgi:hypothetical protein